jgi:hypothetical protein
MYTIDKTDFGYKLVLGGMVDEEEMSRWLEDMKTAAPQNKRDFNVFVDMRTLKPLSKDAQIYIHEAQKLFKSKGMVRSVVILDNPVTTIQFKRIAQETGIYEWERYIDSSHDPDWEQSGMDWLLHAVDPDKKPIDIREG